MTMRVLDQPHDDSPERLDIAAAAARLGISVEAMRKRIQRRQVRAVKVDSRWYVVLDNQDHTSRTTQDIRPGQDSRPVPPVQNPSRTASGPSPTPGQERTAPESAALRELVDALKHQVAHLER